jgi:membrane associated rhomboid family serine protease
MLLPTGLEGKLKFVPIGTIVICCVAVLWSCLHFKEKKVLNEFLKSDITVSTIKSENQFINKYLKLERKRCQKNLSKIKINICINDSTLRLNKILKSKVAIVTYTPAKKNFIEYFKLKQKFRIEYNKLQKDLGYLSNNNLNLFSFLKATFTHADFLHLFFNLLFIALLGVWVEKRIGVFSYICLFLLGSASGFSVHLFTNPTQAIVGSSAGGYTINGLFLSLFFYRNVKFLFIMFPIVFKKITLPNKYFFPLIFVLG